MKVRAAETPPPNEPNRARTRPPWHLAATLAGLLLCAWIPLAPALRSDFAQGFLDPGDSRLVAFVLERNTEWLLGADSSGRSLSDLGIFYPVRDSLFYSDTLLGQLPFWAALRLLARDPVVAYHLLLALLLSLNFLVAHRWLARRDDVTSAGAFFGALLFAIGSPRIAHLFHVQLVAQFPLLLYVETLATALAPGPLPLAPASSSSGSASASGGRSCST